MKKRKTNRELSKMEQQKRETMHERIEGRGLCDGVGKATSLKPRRLAREQSQTG